MPPETSLVRRVAWGSALGASAAALVAALSTSALGAFLLLGAEDRRLQEAAVILSAIIAETPEHLTKAVDDEENEIAHSGIVLVAFSEDGRFLAGDQRVALPMSIGCADDERVPLRVCRTPPSAGIVAVAASPRSLAAPMLAIAALAAAVLAGLVGLLTSFPVARWLIAPLSRLRQSIAEIDIETGLPASLGPTEHVLEVDALRETLRLLIARVGLALDQAHRFAASAAHELRTPLSAVSAELELLAESTTIDETRTDLLRAQRKIAGLATLVERLLILATPRRASTDDSEIVSLRDLLEDVVAMLPAADRERIRTSEGDAVLKGDAVLLATMASNAISNGLKFGHHVTTEVRNEDGLAILQIDDDGPGIPVDERERVFDPFFRTDDALRRRLPGHGLGLALIRHIAQTHGGDASFGTHPHGGARLEIRLARAERASATPSG